MKDKLKEMLELFKQGDSPDSKKQLIELCNDLLELDKNTEVWQILVVYSQEALANSRLSYEVLAPIIIKEHPTICRHPNGSSVRILELTAPTIISDKKRIEHIPAPI